MSTNPNKLHLNLCRAGLPNAEPVFYLPIRDSEVPATFRMTHNNGAQVIANADRLDQIRNMSMIIDDEQSQQMLLDIIDEAYDIARHYQGNPQAIIAQQIIRIEARDFTNGALAFRIFFLPDFGRPEDQVLLHGMLRVLDIIEQGEAASTDIGSDEDSGSSVDMDSNSEQEEPTTPIGGITPAGVMYIEEAGEDMPPAESPPTTPTGKIRRLN